MERAEYLAQLGSRVVASLPATGFGLYDTAGNVWQWTADRYRSDRFCQLAATTDGRPVGDPSDPPTSYAAAGVARGGATNGGNFSLCIF